MKQSELIQPIYNYEIIKDVYLDHEVSLFTNDSRKVIEGAAFIAIRGENFDGHKVLNQVTQQGARMVFVEELPEDVDAIDGTIIKVPSTYRLQAIIANQFYDQPSNKLEVVAVTGTNGKTTTTNMISQTLEALGHKTGLIGTIHNKVGSRIVPTVNTTPDAVALQALFHEMVEEGCQDVLLEASSHALALGRLSYTAVDCAIFTNISREHLDFHKTMEEYTHAKSLLFSQLGQRFHEGHASLAILNIDDAHWEQMAQVTSADILTYSIENPAATAYAHSIESVGGDTHFVIDYRGQSYSALIPMRGIYNISNYLAAFLCIVGYYGYTPSEMIEAFHSFQGVTGRMQSIQEGQKFEVIVDFAHTTDALERVLSDISDNMDETQRLVVLMGHSGGNRDSEARPVLGDILFKYADHLVFTADNPRYESVDKIISEMIGSNQGKSYEIIADRIEAINHVIQTANAEDIILFAGKGGEPYQVIEDQYIPYDEVQVVIEAIQRHL